MLLEIMEPEIACSYKVAGDHGKTIGLKVTCQKLEEA